MRVILEQSHGILDYYFVLEAHEFHDLLDDPWSYDGQIHFPHVDLRENGSAWKFRGGTPVSYFLVEFRRELHRFEELELLVREPPVLVG